jgi:hypothetical protein
VTPPINVAMPTSIAGTNQCKRKPTPSPIAIQTPILRNTMSSLRISMGGGFPERPQRHAPHAVMRPDMVAIVVLRQLCLPLL